MADVLCDCRAGHDAIGHDRLGHLVTNTLARAGLLPASNDVLARVTDAQLQALPGLGPVAVRRFRAAVGGGTAAATGRRASSQARSRKAQRGRLHAVSCTCPPGLVFLGHDELGHRLSMLLARAGWFAGDVDAFALLTDAQLLEMRQVGPVALARVREHIAYRAPARPARRGGDGSRPA